MSVRRDTLGARTEAEAEAHAETPAYRACERTSLAGTTKGNIICLEAEKMSTSRWLMISQYTSMMELWPSLVLRSFSITKRFLKVSPEKAGQWYLRRKRKRAEEEKGTT